MLKDKSMTYVTLFSSAGVGCHGFQMEGYHCIATNEIIERRMQVQRCNHKCDDDSGYIVGDITSDEIKQRIYDEIHRWEKKGNDRVDVMHHIFPQSEFAEIADYIENLIALTSGQHLQKAHPNGNTRIIDKQYQYTCLIAKTESIRKNIMANKGEPVIYDFAAFMYVLDVGLNTDYFEALPSCDFNSVVTGIEFNY